MSRRQTTSHNILVFYTAPATPSAIHLSFRWHYCLMCSHYQALKDRERMWRRFGVDITQDMGNGDTWPLYLAPFVRRDPEKLEHTRQGLMGQFGLLAHWAKDKTLARKTYNARTESVAEKPTYRDVWRKGQRCIIPAEWIFEPSWETGKAVPWKIAHVDGEPLGIAGLWNRWRTPEGVELHTFTMLTVNAADHPLMKRFHRPDDEKRMVVILDPADFDRWLDCPPENMVGMMQQYPADLLTAEPSPLPPRRKKDEAEDVQRDLL